MTRKTEPCFEGGVRHLREECGVVGVVGSPEAAKFVYLGLHALQHRGQEGCGIVTIEPDDEVGKRTFRFQQHKSLGLVGDTFDEDNLAKLKGSIAVGHVRYSTQGGKLIQNIQPFHFRTALGPLAIAHNGNLTNAKIIREKLEGEGAIFQTTSDTEVFIHLLARGKGDSLLNRIFSVMSKLRGAYSLVLATADRLFAVRDPFGFRPLVIGRRNKAVVVASETCALDLIDADFLREVEPGEVVEIDSGQILSHKPLTERPPAYCAFEPIYFARPDSRVFGEVVYDLRKKMGEVLAREAPAPGADLVFAVPDSGVPMAMGYAQEAGLPLELGLVRNHYVGRTFIEPSQEIRDFGVKLKLNPIRSILAGKSVVVVDDSVVRGTTSTKIMRMISEAGAREVHMRIGSPPITHSCFYGVDTPAREKLLAARKNVEEIRQFIGANSLAYLSLDGLREALGTSGKSSYCVSCFDGRYPEEIFEDIPEQPTDIGGTGLISNTI